MFCCKLQMSQMYKKVNRRNNIFNHLNRNVVYPSLFLSSDDINKRSSVEIIELKSDEETEKEQQDKSNYSHVWCYEGDDQESNYKINREARERQAQYGNDEIYNELLDRMCTKLYGIDRHKSHDTAHNREAKCFTIINNHISYDTSSDDDVEIQYSDTILNGNGSDAKSFDDNASYTNGYGEKRTVWIYSEKSKKELLDDYGLKNTPNISTSTSTTDNEESVQDIDIGCIRRLATPIPTYIPKLFLPLSPTLPTVTEVMESYNKSSSNTEINQSKSMTPQMPINNWVYEQSVEHESDLHHKVNNDTFSWDALTPREKTTIKSSMNKENIYEIDQESRRQPKSKNEDIIEREIESQIDECQTSIANELHLKSSSSDEINNLQKPQIKITGKIKPTREIITDPLEKENGQWIGDEAHDTLDVYDYDLDRNDIVKDTSDLGIKNYNSAGNEFLVTNMSLLKPTEWTQYLPITGSVPSLQLSFETEAEENKSWLTRLLKCFRCCKRYNK